MSDGLKKITTKVQTKLKNIENKVKSKAKEFNERVEEIKEEIQEDAETLELFDTYRNELYYLPVIEEPDNAYCFLLNIFLPGTGSMYAGYLSKNKTDKNVNIFIGIIQLLTAFFIIGWIFSIIWGFFIFRRGSGIMKFVKKKYK